jgi:uncharacterized membrane protein YczE
VVRRPGAVGLPRRLRRLLTGLVAMGAGIGLMADADLGLGPWDVLHQGLSHHTGLSLGTLNIAVGAAVLLLWVPLRQRPGIGTVLNVLIIGVVVDATLALLPEPDHLAVRTAAMLGGVVLMGVGSGLYIGAGLGPGPRDGLMTGVAVRGHSVRSVRTALEVTVLIMGWALGGTVGVGTVVLAVAIGPLVQASLEWLGLPSDPVDSVNAQSRPA